MKNLYILVSLIFLFVTVNCFNESTPIYWDRGMVEISLVQTERLDFFIPDEGDSGWNHYDDPGEDIVTLDFTVKNQSDMQLPLSGIDDYSGTGTFKFYMTGYI